MVRLVSRLALGAAAATAPAAAFAQAKLTPALVIADAAPSLKLVMLVLVVAVIAAVAITARKVTQGPHLAGGSTYLSALRLGGPLVGLLGASYTRLRIAFCLANISPASVAVIWPGVAGLMSLVALGLIAGVVAVICHGVVEARIDRAVLRS